MCIYIYKYIYTYRHKNELRLPLSKTKTMIQELLSLYRAFTVDAAAFAVKRERNIYKD